MAITQVDIAQQMVQQLRILDPSVSAEVGTPERKLIDTVAEAIAEAKIDITSLDGSLDLDAKLGGGLDRFLALFGFTRQKATFATGIAEFSRNTPATFDILIPANAQIATAPLSAASPASEVQIRTTFTTTVATTLSAGETSVLVPIRAATSGTLGNVAADAIQSFVGQPVLGITGVTNPTSTLGGQDQESDDELKVRFTNTVFRNLAGTSDQYLALAASTPFTTKANVISAISRYREYIQVPNVDDASIDDVNDDGTGESGNGNPGEFTTALSTIPYSKYTYDTVPTFVSNGKLDVDAVFYTEGIDFLLNTIDADKNRGDAYRLFQAGIGANPFEEPYQPSVTMTNVYTGDDFAVQAARPGDILLFEHSYLSDASRNDFIRNILNCVDIYVNGKNETQVIAVIPRPALGINDFNGDTGDRRFFGNYRRTGEPDHRPVLGNIFTPLYWQPVLDLPEQIVVGSNAYIKGTHYWPIQDISPQGGTVRSRNGVEWSIDVKAKTGSDLDEGPFTGKRITELTDSDATSIAIDQYSFDRNIPDLQTAAEGSKQVTTDVLVHQADIRYFRLDVTVMYNAGAATSDVNANIQTAVQSLLDTHYFGQAIQLSDFLQTIHNVPGIDNVRWTRDVDPFSDKVMETNSLGVPRLGVISDRVLTGRSDTDFEGGQNEVQQIYLSGNPTGGSFTLTMGETTTADLDFTIDASGLQSALAAAIPTPISATVTGLGGPDSPFQITLDPNTQKLLIGTSSLTGGDRVFNNDFFLKDNELPSLPTEAQEDDDVPGLRIRPRAQSTWTKGD